MSSFVTDNIETDNRLVLKHGNKILAIADYDTPPLEELFTAEGEPTALPSVFRQMGYITTDGVTQGNDVSSNDVNMDQDVEPVRSDIESIARTLGVTFGEANAWVNGLFHGLPVAEWPTDKSAAWDYTFGDITDPPFYRLLLLTQDGTGSQTKYRVEQAYKAKVTNLGERTLNRADPEGFQFTFGLYKDPATGKTYRRAQNGPFYLPETP